MENKTAAGQLISGIRTFADQATPKRIFLAVFLYIASVSFFIQLVLLPFVFPSWQVGDGLLTSSWDSRRFNSLAVKMAAEISSSGWQAWEFRPQQHSPAGIAAAIYALTVPKPWTLIPLNSALHAFAATAIWLIVYALFIKRWIATVSVIPFVFFPSAMQWYAQIHKEGMTILGSLMVLGGWLILIRHSKQSPVYSSFLKSILLVTSGAFLAWVSRPENIQLIFGASIPVLGFLILIVGLSFVRKDIERARWATLNFCVGLILLAAMFPFATRGGLNEEIGASGSNSVNNANNESRPKSETDPSSRNYWESSSWMPKEIDGIFRSISKVRNRYLVTPGYSNIDTDIIFRSAADVISYVPRATVVAFLAPFPDLWGGQAYFESNTLMRRVSALETIIVYLCLLGLLSYIWVKKGTVGFWATLLFCYFYMLPLALVIVNVGTLYRFRWGALMTIAALGIAGGLDLAKRRTLGGPQQGNS